MSVTVLHIIYYIIWSTDFLFLVNISHLGSHKLFDLIKAFYIIFIYFVICSGFCCTVLYCPVLSRKGDQTAGSIRPKMCTRTQWDDVMKIGDRSGACQPVLASALSARGSASDCLALGWGGVSSRPCAARSEKVKSSQISANCAKLSMEMVWLNMFGIIK
jgi:hypothetical protein